MTRYESASFQAMGTTVEVLAAPALPAPSLERVKAHFASMEARFSRFDRDSELSRVNAAAGRPVLVSPLFQEVLAAALRAAESSGGLFDPLLLKEVEAAGYRQSIDLVRGSMQVAVRPRPGAANRHVEVCRDGWVVIPEGTGLDLGGFAKGWAVESCARLMRGCDSWLVNAGGDLLARGGGPGGAGWIVGIEDPFAPGSNVAVIAVEDRAVATSSITRRRWMTQEGVAHHLIDPRTGLPSQTDLVSATVIAGAVPEAEVRAKQMLLLGKTAALAFASERHVPALVVDDGGSVTVTPGMEAYLVA